MDEVDEVVVILALVLIGVKDAQDLMIALCWQFVVLKRSCKLLQ